MTARRGAARNVRHCRDVIDLLTEYMEGGLTATETRRLEAHLAGCSSCAEYLASVKRTAAAARTLGAAEVPDDCRRALRAFLNKGLKPRRR